MTCSILIHVHLCKFARLPAPSLRSHFNRSKAPVLAMVVAPSPPQPSPLQCLIIVQHSQNSKYDWDSCVQLDTHKRVRHALADVLKVHRSAFDEDTNGDDGIEWPAGDGNSGGRRGACARLRVWRNVTEEIFRCITGLIHMRASDHPEAIPTVSDHTCSDLQPPTLNMQMAIRSFQEQTESRY